MTRDGLSQRALSELEFHNNWADSIDLDKLSVKESFEAATAMENRYALERLSPVAGRRILDLGCGAGETSVYFALQGASVDAVDVSPGMIQVAMKLAERFGVCPRFQTCQAEKLPFPDDTFDLVFGNGVLHHVDILPALAEVKRVLRPGGRAAFVEPLKHNPAIKLYRHLARDNRTRDERPLGFDDLDRMRGLFPGLEHKEFWLFTLYLFVHFFAVERLSPGKVRYWKRIIEDAERYKSIFQPLKRLDDAVLSLVPSLGCLCWNTVICVRKEP